MRKIRITLSIAIFLISIANAQEFAIKKVELTADQIVLHYDLLDTTKNRTYTIRVYSSSDKFLAPLTKVAGDEGIEVKPGMNKKIVWNSKEELGATFIGNIELEVRGRVYIPFIRLVGFEDVPVRKRKNPFIVKWTGGTSQNVLNFQLYNKVGKLVHTFPNAPNELQYRITIPASVKTGKDYYFKISDSKDTEQVVISSRFMVKPKIPLVVKAIPILAIGGVLYYVIGNGVELKDLDGPPSKPTGPN